MLALSGQKVTRAGVILRELPHTMYTNKCYESAKNALKILLDNAEKTNIPVPCEAIAELEFIIQQLKPINETSTT